jgi:hypothetical protein
MKDDKLIRTLVADLSPVKAKNPIRITVFSLAAGIIVTPFIFILLMTVRPDLQKSVNNPIFLFSVFSSLLICLIGVFTSIFLSTPGRNPKYLIGLLGISLTGLMLTLLIWPNSNAQGSLAGGQSCSIGAILLGTFSFIIFGFAAKKMAPQNPGLVGALCGVGAGCIGMTAIAFHCPSESSLHLLIWHLSLPLIGFGILGYFLGQKFLRW